jgi:hypothetical protein
MHKILVIPSFKYGNASSHHWHFLFLLLFFLLSKILTPIAFQIFKKEGFIFAK